MENITDINKTLKGLSNEEVKASKEQYGTNALTPKKTATLWEMLLGSLDDICIKILLIALAVKVVMVVIGIWVPEFHADSDAIEIGSIFAAVCLATGISTVSEYKNTSRSSALQEEYSKTYAKVMRNGELISILTSEIVKDDIILLQSGDKVPVDGLIIKGELKVSQAALNGESRSEEKVATNSMEFAEITDTANKNKVFMGSVVEAGEAYMVATVIGDKSQLGVLNATLNKATEEKQKDATSTKLEVLLGQVNKLGITCAAIAGVINVISSLARRITPFESAALIGLALSTIMLIASIIIMAVPEGLATVVSLVQSRNTENLYKKHILVSHKARYADSAFMNVLFSDKTGTITYGSLTLVEFIMGNGQIKSEASADLIDSITINNSAKISKGKAIGSNNMDRALLEYAIAHGYTEENSKRDMVAKPNEFNSEQKCATTEMKDGSVHWKGATELILDKVTHWYNDNELVPFTQEDRTNLENTMKNQMVRCMKLLSVAKIVDGKTILLAVLCCRDDVRADAKETVHELSKSGIRIVMVTGDNKDTAIAIAKEADIYNESRGDITLTHDELDAMSDDELIKIMPRLSVVSRAQPLDKQRLVQLSQNRLKNVVGMTGDGVNDAPALAQSNVGFAMGDGTPVAQQAGHVILLDNSLTAIKDCILNSRTMAKSISKFIIFQLSINVATLIMNILAPVTGWTEPFSIVQILYINLIMDTLAALSFAGEPALERYMNEPPAKRDAKLLTPYVKSAITVSAVFVSIGCLAILCFGQQIFGNMLGIADVSDGKLRTIMFAFFIYAALFNSFNTRSENTNILEHIGQNKSFVTIIGTLFIAQTLIIQFGGKAFSTVHLTPKEFLFAFIAGALIIPVDMIRKAFTKLIAKTKA